MIPSIERRRVHLLGIGGTGMGSLAGLLSESGFLVTGSDQGVYSPSSELLAGLGIQVRSPYAPSNLPDCDLVIVGNAISRGNPELEAVLDRRLPYASMPEVVKELYLRRRLPIVIAGTHGKTTTTSLLAWMLVSGGREPGFLVGGVPVDLGTGFGVGKGEPFIIEGDEYDSAYFDKGPKFLHYLPQIAVLLNVEFDHADIYRDMSEVTRAFGLFVNLVPGNGLLVVGRENAAAMALAAKAPCPVSSFALEGEADWTLDALEVSERGSRFRIRHRGRVLTETTGAFWGPAAFRNILAAVAVASHLGLESSQITRALETFRGVRRRLEVRGVISGVTVVDDFAHHPTAVRASLEAARERWPGRKIWGLFEPRSFTARSRVFQDDMAEALSDADEVVVAEVMRSSRLLPEDELVEERLVEDLRAGGTEAWFIPEVDEIVRLLSSRAAEGDVILAMSNGGFGGLHQRLLEAL